MLEFKSVEEMQAHYKATRNRIANAPTRFRPKPPEPPKASEPLPQIVQLHPYLKHAQNPPTASQTVSMAFWFAKCDKFLERESLQLSNAPMRGTLEKGVDHPKIWLEELVALVCLEINMNPKLVWSPRRFKELTEARFLIWALAREFCWQHSLPTIGKFCKRDHTTVMHGAKQGKKNPAYPELARQVCVILSERELGG